MATTITTDYSGEKRLSSSAPNLSNEDFNPEGLQSGNLDPSSRDEDRGLDNTGIKSISKRIEPLPGTPQHETSNNAELPPEPAAEQPGLPGKDYSILTVAQKRTIVVAASFAALFSPMATAIYCKYLIPVIVSRICADKYRPFTGYNFSRTQRVE